MGTLLESKCYLLDIHEVDFIGLVLLELPYTVKTRKLNKERLKEHRSFLGKRNRAVLCSHRKLKHALYGSNVRASKHPDAECIKRETMLNKSTSTFVIIYTKDCSICICKDSSFT